MNGTTILLVAVVIAVVLVIRRLSLISTGAARRHLREGALVVDVRSAEEYRGGHLPNAVNIPLGELKEVLPARVTDKNQVLLLHCLSGTRSAVAKRQMKSMGSPNVFNLGSYGRAERIVAGTE